MDSNRRTGVGLLHPLGEPGGAGDPRRQDRLRPSLRPSVSGPTWGDIPKANSTKETALGSKGHKIPSTAPLTMSLSQQWSLPLAGVMFFFMASKEAILPSSRGQDVVGHVKLKQTGNV